LQRVLRLMAAICATTIIAGCASLESEIVYLKHPVKGDIIKCGPYSAWPFSRFVSRFGAVVGGNFNRGDIPEAYVTVEQELRYCIKIKKRLGYQRIPAPGS